MMHHDTCRGNSLTINSKSLRLGKWKCKVSNFPIRLYKLLRDIESNIIAIFPIHVSIKSGPHERIKIHHASVRQLIRLLKDILGLANESRPIATKRSVFRIDKQSIMKDLHAKLGHLDARSNLNSKPILASRVPHCVVMYVVNALASHRKRSRPVLQLRAVSIAQRPTIDTRIGKRMNKLVGSKLWGRLVNINDLSGKRNFDSSYKDSLIAVSEKGHSGIHSHTTRTLEWKIDDEQQLLIHCKWAWAGVKHGNIYTPYRFLDSKGRCYMI